MKKKVLLSLCLLFIPFVSVSATGISANPSNVTITTGESKNVTVTVTNLAALMDVSSSNNSVVTVNKAHLDLTSNGPGSTSGTITLTGVSAGNANITIKTSDATDFDGNDYSQTVNIKVTVNNPTTTTTTTTTTKPKSNPQPKQEPSTRTTQAPQQTVTEAPQQVVEEPTLDIVEETTTSLKDDNSNGVDDEIELKSLKVVGYPIEFDPKVDSYSINIGDANAIYLSAVPLTEGAVIDKNGEINVEGLESIELNLKYNEKISKITIYLNRNKNIEPSPKTDETKSNKGMIVLASIETTIILMLIVAFIYKDQIIGTFDISTKHKSKKGKLNIFDEKNIKNPINFDK